MNPPMPTRSFPKRIARQPQYPVISLVTCSYQQGRHLGQTIRSVVEQNYPALEYIVIDGGSSDGSVEIIKRHELDLAYWVSEPDKGQTHALIKGFDRSRGEILGWLCSDDLLLPGALHAVGEFFSTHPEVMAAYGDALWIDAGGCFLRPKKEIDFNRFVFLYDHNYIPQPSMFWRRTLYEAVNGLDPDYELAMDADLWQRFSERTRIAHIPQYLSCMRFYPAQKTRSRRTEGRREDAAIRRRGGSRFGRGIAYRALRLAARCVRVSAKAWAGGYTAAARAEHLNWLERCAGGDIGK